MWSPSPWFRADESEYLMRDYRTVSFNRTLRPAGTLDASKAEAKLPMVVLTLRLAKAESARPKTIKVAVK